MYVSHPTSAEPVADELAELISTIGDARFDESFLRVCTSMLGADYCSLYVFPKDGPPRMPLFAANAPECPSQVVQASAQYLEQDYLQDARLARVRRTRNTLLEVCHADDERDAELQDRYFNNDSNINDLVCLVGQLETDILYVVLYRLAEREAVRPDEIETVLRNANFLLKVSWRHDQLLKLARWRNTFAMLDSGSCSTDDARHTFAEILTDRTTLTCREAEICSYLMLGYSVEATSLNCGVSPNTIATHRKRAYNKLRVASHSALFQRVADLTPDVPAARNTGLLLAAR